MYHLPSTEIWCIQIKCFVIIKDFESIFFSFNNLFNSFVLCYWLKCCFLGKYIIWNSRQQKPSPPSCFNIVLRKIVITSIYGVEGDIIKTQMLKNGYHNNINALFLNNNLPAIKCVYNAEKNLLSNLIFII